MTDEHLVKWWTNALKLAARDRLGRIAALVSGCSQLSSTLSIKVPQASDRPELNDKIDHAVQQGYPIGNPAHVHWARDLRNECTHDASVPSHLDALKAVKALADADFALRQSGSEALSRVATEHQRLVDAGVDPVVDPAHTFDLRHGEDISIIILASRSNDAADRGAAILITSSLLERNLDELIHAKMSFSDERKELLSLGLKPKLAMIFELGWIAANDEERRFVFDALTARNRCAHEDEAPSLDDAEQQVADILDIARDAASQVTKRVAPSPDPEPVRPDTVVRPPQPQPRPSELRTTGPYTFAAYFVAATLTLGLLLVGLAKTESGSTIDTSWTKNLAAGPVDILRRTLPDSVAVVAWDSDTTRSWVSAPVVPPEAKWSRWAELACGAGGNVFDVLMNLGEGTQGIRAAYLDDPHGFAFPKARIELICGRRFEAAQQQTSYGMASLLLVSDQALAGWIRVISSSVKPSNNAKDLNFEEKIFGKHSGVCFRVEVGGVRGLEAPRCDPVFSKSLSLESADSLVGGTHIQLKQFLTDRERARDAGSAWASRLSNLAPHVTRLDYWEVAAMESQDPCGELFAYFGSQVGLEIDEASAQVMKSGLWGNPFRTDATGWARGIGRIDAAGRFTARMVIGTATESEAASLARNVSLKREECTTRLQGVRETLHSIFVRRDALLIRRIIGYAILDAYLRAVTSSQVRVVGRNAIWDLSVQLSESGKEVLGLYLHQRQLRAEMVARMIGTAVSGGKRPTTKDLESLVGAIR